MSTGHPILFDLNKTVFFLVYFEEFKTDLLLLCEVHTINLLFKLVNLVNLVNGNLVLMFINTVCCLHLIFLKAA